MALLGSVVICECGAVRDNNWRLKCEECGERYPYKALALPARADKDIDSAFRTYLEDSDAS